MYLQALQVLPSPLAVLVNPAGKNIYIYNMSCCQFNFNFSSYIVSLDSHCVLLVPEDRQLLGRLSIPGTKTSVRVGVWPELAPLEVWWRSFYRGSRLPVFPGRTLLENKVAHFQDVTLGGPRNDCGHLVWFLPLVPLSLHREPLCLLGGLEIPSGPEVGVTVILLLF